MTKILQCIVASLTVLATGIAWGSQDIDPAVRSAFERLLDENSLYPKDATPADQAAMEALRDSSDATIALLQHELSKGGASRPRATNLINLVPPDRKVAVARSIQDTYEVGDPKAPFSGLLTVLGTEKDMDRMRELIARWPDEERTQRQAALMAGSGNQYAESVLLEMRASAPGRWQEVDSVSEFFRRNGVQAVKQLASEQAPSEAGDQVARSQTERLRREVGTVPSTAQIRNEASSDSTPGVSLRYILLTVFVGIAAFLVGRFFR